MVELTQWTAAVAIGPLVALVVICWAMILFGRGEEQGRADARPGAILVSVAALFVGGTLLGGWVVPPTVGWSLTVAGAVIGAVVSWRLFKPERAQ